MASTVYPEPKSKYAADYKEALVFFNLGEAEKTVEAAKYNLTDTTLPGYWQVKNCIILACATDDFHQAEFYRIAGEKVWKRAAEQTDKEDEYEQSWLAEIRQGLDELRVTQEEERELNGLGDEEPEQEEEEDVGIVDFGYDDVEEDIDEDEGLMDIDEAAEAEVEGSAVAQEERRDAVESGGGPIEDPMDVQPAVDKVAQPADTKMVTARFKPVVKVAQAAEPASRRVSSSGGEGWKNDWAAWNSALEKK